MQAKEFRRPASILIVVFTEDGEALLLHREKPFDFWQSITGSLQVGESHADAARRELFEETGLGDEGTLHYSGVSRQFVIDARWRDRFEPGVIENVEFEWHYRMPARADIEISHEEHSEYCWLPIATAAKRVWSWTNRDALNGTLFMKVFNS
jgi:dATP pyrophosphohydrolase